MKDGPWNKDEYRLSWPVWWNETKELMTKLQQETFYRYINEFLMTDKTRTDILDEIENRAVQIVFNLVAFDFDRQINEHYPARIRNSKEYQEWRSDVFERDHYICQNCGQVGGSLNAHHIKSFKDYPDLRLDVNNGITLCLKCHKLAHRKRGD